MAVLTRSYMLGYCKKSMQCVMIYLEILFIINHFKHMERFRGEIKGTEKKELAKEFLTLAEVEGEAIKQKLVNILLESDYKGDIKIARQHLRYLADDIRALIYNKSCDILGIDEKTSQDTLDNF